MKHVRWAVRELDRALCVDGVSAAYQARAVAAPGSPTFLNAAVAIRTPLDAVDLKYRVLRPIEARLGRARTSDPNAPRTIDIDIALIGTEVVVDDRLGIRVPDPEIPRRAHLALPLRDLDPALAHPSFGATLEDVAAGPGFDRDHAAPRHRPGPRADRPGFPPVTRRSPGPQSAVIAPILLAIGLTALADRSIAAQEPPTIDSVLIEQTDVFPPKSGDGNPFAGILNALHVNTRPGVIESELLFEAGVPYDSLLFDESERNLRRRFLFRTVRVDTLTIDDRLTARVRTRDAWSLLPRANFQVASDGRLTGTFGLTENNVIGTGNQLRVWYVREADRDGMILSGGLPRLAGSNLAAGGAWATLSDRESGSWTLASPFRSNSDRHSVFYGGDAFTGRVRQYRVESPVLADTADYHRRALINRGYYTYAPIAGPDRYLRLGASAEVRREEYILTPAAGADPDSAYALVPDSIYGQVSVYGEYRRSRFARVGRFNGFAEEDQDLSDLVFLSTVLAPGGWGYRETGVGARLLLRKGLRAGPAIIKGVIDGNALFNSAGLDSGTVVATGTVALRVAERHATFLQVSAGAREDPPPGAEFDLGFQVMPRLWGPHAFVGDRTLRMTLEHRFFAIDGILDLLGVGLGAFADYGGAWYEDQDRRMGGNVGLSMFFGAPLTGLAQINHLSGGYRFGGGIEDSGRSGWALTFGTGIVF